MEQTETLVPIETMEEIICRLPVEAFHRFRCVASSFNKLVSEYRLARKHLSYAIKHENTHLLFLARSMRRGKVYVRACPLSSIPGRAHQDSRDVELPLPPCEKGYLFHDNKKATMMKIHNGFVCVDNHRPIFVYDLVSGTLTRVPEITIEPNFFTVDTLICYDPTYDDYIIIRFSLQLRCQVWIYSLKGMCWRSTEDWPYHFPSGGCVFANGHFYWMAKAGRFTDTLGIVSVDPNFRDLELMRVPEYVGRGNSVQCLKLINVQEKLYVYNNNKYQRGEEVEYCSIWETPLSAASWTKVLSIPLKLIRHYSDEFRILYLYESLGVVLMMTTSKVGIRELWWIFRDGTVLYKEALDDDGTFLVGGGIVHEGPIANLRRA